MKKTILTLLLQSFALTLDKVETRIQLRNGEISI